MRKHIRHIADADGRNEFVGNQNPAVEFPPTLHMAREQPFDGIDEVYNQKIGEVLNFFASKLQLYYSSSRLTLLLTYWIRPTIWV